MIRALGCGLIGLALSVTGCMDLPIEEEVTVEVSVDLRDKGRADRILVDPGKVHFHVSGTPRAEAWRGEPLSPGAWVAVPGHEAAIDLAQLHGRGSARLAQGALPILNYDHLFLELGWVRALDANGKDIPIANIVEPIAMHLDASQLPGARVHIELIVMDNWPSEGSLSVFVKNATLYVQ